jgi:hypothetical protein
MRAEDGQTSTIKLGQGPTILLFLGLFNMFFTDGHFHRKLRHPDNG